MTRFEEVLAKLEVLEKAQASAATGSWSVAQTVAHCAQSVEFSMTGFPKPASFIVRGLFGPIVMKRFLAKGEMKHDLAAPIPGAPDLGSPSLTEAAARLRKAIADFRAYSGEFRPHFAYGPVNREQYEALHSMHFGDHFKA